MKKATKPAVPSTDVSDPFDADFVRRLEYWSLLFKRVWGGDLSAARRSREVGSGIEFADRREYAPGDDPRYLDWKAYARLDRVLLRLFEEEKDLRVHLLLDRSASMGVGRPSKLLACKRIAAALAYIVLANLDRVSICPFDERPQVVMPPTRGKARIHAILESLGRIEAAGTTDVALVARELAAREKRRALVFVLSDLLVQGGVPEALDRLRYHGHEVALIRMLSSQDRSPEVSGEVEMLDAESGVVLRAVVTPAVLARYRDRFAAMTRELEAMALRRGARLIHLSSEDPFDDHIATVLRSMARAR